jgi:phytanoyl-CoA hydroxylase
MDVYQKEYADKGYTALGEIIPRDNCSELNNSLSSQINGDFFERTGFGLLGQNAYQKIPLFEDALKRFQIPKIAATLLNLPSVLLFQDLIIWKPPYSKRTVEWHQDYSYWPLNAPEGMTIWIALDDASKENGAIRYIPQSHSWGECSPTIYTLEDAFQADGPLPTLPLKEQADKGVFVECKQGSGIAHHPLSCHMSPKNKTNGNRRAWSLTFIDPNIGWDPAHAPHPLNHQLQLAPNESMQHSQFPIFSLH